LPLRCHDDGSDLFPSASAILWNDSWSIKYNANKGKTQDTARKIYLKDSLRSSQDQEVLVTCLFRD
jgi:hypothetical protein